MRRCFTTLLLSIAISVLLLHSFHVHLFRDLVHGDEASSLPPSAAVASLGGGGLFHRHNLAIRDLPPTPSRLFPPLPLVSILFPDWEAFLLLPLLPSAADHRNLSCLFHNGAVSPAGFVGILPTSPARSAFRCPIPTSVRHHRPSCTPRLIDPTTAAPKSDGHDPHCKMIRWTRLVYEAVSTPTDVIVFAKGVNSLQGVNRHASDLRCLFFSSAGGVASTPVTSSSQEVFRCPHPPATAIPVESRTDEALRISLAIAAGGSQIPSLANYNRPRVPGNTTEPRALICACTMVHNVAKFLAEWIAYHSAIGVERFFLYDNGSDDELHSVVDRLGSGGYNISIRFWPWPKTHEAGFSHCAAVNRDTCTWMAFVDVDEFIFSPAWAWSAPLGAPLFRNREGGGEGMAASLFPCLPPPGP